MALEKNATCEICGKEYVMCQTCSGIETFKPWRTVTDSMEHYKIYFTIWAYKNGMATKEQAKNELENCDLKDYKNFLPNIVSVIDEIFEAENEKKTTAKKNKK